MIEALFLVDALGRFSIALGYLDHRVIEFWHEK